MLVTLLVLISLACLSVGALFLKQALALTATATSYIRSAAQGYVVLEGEGLPMPGRSIHAPFSGKPCVWWSTQVESLTGPSAAARFVPNPEAFDKHLSTEPFLLRDGTGECCVDPTEADVRTRTSEIWYGRSFDANALQAAKRTRGANDDLRFVEERIELHQRIQAHGYFQTHEDASADRKTNTLSPPPDGRRFLLSTVPETDMAKRLRVQAMLAFCLCVALAACAVYAGQA